MEGLHGSSVDWGFMDQNPQELMNTVILAHQEKIIDLISRTMPQQISFFLLIMFLPTQHQLGSYVSGRGRLKQN